MGCDWTGLKMNLTRFLTVAKTEVELLEPSGSRGKKRSLHPGLQVTHLISLSQQIVLVHRLCVNPALLTGFSLPEHFTLRKDFAQKIDAYFCSIGKQIA